MVRWIITRNEKLSSVSITRILFHYELPSPQRAMQLFESQINYNFECCFVMSTKVGFNTITKMNIHISGLVKEMK